MRTGIKALEHYPVREEPARPGPAAEALAWIRALASDWEDRQHRTPGRESSSGPTSRETSSRSLRWVAMVAVSPAGPSRKGDPLPAPAIPSASDLEPPGALGSLAL